MSRLFFISLVGFLTACSYSPTTYDLDMTLPSEFIPATASTEQGITVDKIWWQSFQSEQLTSLMQHLAQNNLSLKDAELRVRQAKHLLSQSQAGDWPVVSASVSGRMNRDMDNSSTSNSSSGSISMGYEVDVWGGRDAEQLGRKLGIVAAQYQQRSIELQIQSLFLSAIFNQFSLAKRADFAAQNVEASSTLLKLVSLRHQAGDAAGIEVSQQRNTLLSARADLLNTQNALTINSRVISVLLGQSQMPEFTPTADIYSFTVPTIDLIQSADILQQRPDVALAKIQLQQSDIALYQASINGLPGLNLSASLSVGDILKLADDWTLSALISSAATLFDGGRLDAAERVAQTEVELALNNYRAVVLDATAELMDAMSRYQYQKRAYDIDKATLDNNQRLYNLAEIRYKAGDTDFLNLLNAQRSWFTAQLSVISGYQAMLDASIDVFRAAAGKPN